MIIIAGVFVWLIKWIFTNFVPSLIQTNKEIAENFAEKVETMTLKFENCVVEQTKSATELKTAVCELKRLMLMIFPEEAVRAKKQQELKAAGGHDARA